MSSITPSRKAEETCGICQTEIKNSQGITHVGGERHDGFHPVCLDQWLNRNPTCPFDKTPINPKTMPIDRNVLVARILRITEIGKNTLLQAGYAAFFGAITATLGGATFGPANQADIEHRVIAEAGVFLGTVISGTVSALLSAEERHLASILRIVFTISTGYRMGANAGLAIGAAGFAGEGINWILSRRGVNPIDRINIGAGMVVGGFGTFLCIRTQQIAANFLTNIASTSLAGGVAAGVLSLIRRRLH